MNLIPFKGRNYSGPTNLNYLWNEDKVYIMDNHLVAGWCWLQNIDSKKKYNFFHIDRHYDLSDHLLEWWLEVIEAENFNHERSTIENLLSLRFVRKDMPESQPMQLFRWDNYISIVDSLYPELWFTRSFATQKDGDLPDVYKKSHFPEPYELPVNLGYWLENKNGSAGTVLNLDVDYFFINHGDKVIQFLSDDYVRAIGKEIKSAWKHITVLTICLSPECCGGWEKANRICKIITEELSIDWHLPI